MSDPSLPGGPHVDPDPGNAHTLNSHLENSGPESTQVTRVQPEASYQTPYVTMQRPPRRRHHFVRIAASGLLLAAGVFLGVAISHDFWQAHTSTAAQVRPAGGSASTGSGSLPFGTIGGSGSGATGSLGSVDAIAAAVSPGLVDINVTQGYQSGQGAATGIVLTSNGLVLTNNHVIDGATSISATDVGNGQTYSATVVGYDRSHDIAVIQLNGASGLKTAQIGDSSKATVGQRVVAIGNAGGVGGTPSAAAGSLVALDQQITAGDASSGVSEQLSGLMQTDAAIQPGDSGGPLVNTAGQVIGVDTAASGGYSIDSQQGQGFAVPVNTAIAVATQIANHQASATVHIGATGFLGVEIDPSASQGAFGGQSGSTSSGATVAGVLSGSPAEKAGLAAGDVIVSVDGQSVDSPTGLSTLLGSHHPGDQVQIGWVDQSGAQHTSSVQLATGPAA